MRSTREITEAGLFAALTTVMIVGAFYIPLLGSVMALLLPVPIIVLAVKNKPLYVIVSAFVAIVISGLIISFLNSLTMGIMALLVGLPIGFAMKHKQKNLVAILYGSIGAALGFLIVFKIMEVTTGITLLQTIEESFGMSMDMQSGLTSAIEGLGVDTTASLAEAQLLLEEMLYVIKLIMPAMMLVFSMFYASINLIFSHHILKRLRIDHLPVGAFDQFSFPKHMAYGSVGMIALAYLLGKMGTFDIDLLSANFAYLFITIFSVQGMAVIYHFMKRRSGKAAGVIVIVLLAVFGLLNYIAFLGFFDVMMDLRKLRNRESE